MRVLLLLLLLAPTAKAVPVVPNFSTGSMTTHTETTSNVTEVIVSETYKTGWEYSVSGTNIQHDGSSLSPGSTSINSWTGLDASRKPNWTIVRPGEAFQLMETLENPGLSNITTIERTTEITQITDTISTFSQ
tara:strand:+ start:114 stop:512 length:399 start_codon:yes stop_codon:yes gene_type:complete